ncbi:hypothetical protein BaRGS_00026679 [Batillaria attramentaria]|uniref:non-specific serine/threonine protein kinase n=1 Tax=Batillaria attramentaria TaxID=370345 RepID=A0ABD0K5A9_9CAEN
MSASMTEHISRRLGMNPGISQVHKDITDERYRDLRRPRKVRFFVNGDRFFKGKKLYITPHRYYNFNDLLNDLTGKLPSSLNLPYGVRQIFTPVGGRRVSDIEDLQDGETYVCAGFEGFKTIKYGRTELEPWSVGKTVRLQNLQAEETGSDVSYGSYKYRGYQANAFHPGRYFRTNGQQQTHRRWPGTFGNTHNTRPAAGLFGGQTEAVPMKPKVVTIVRNGPRPRNNVKILLNRRSVQSFEQLISDISEALGPKWKNNRVRKLFTTHGKEVRGVADFFREDDCFIAMGNEGLSESDVADIISELYPDSAYAKILLKDWEKQRRKAQKGNNLTAKDGEGDKRDSGIADSSDNGSHRDQDYDPSPSHRSQKGHHHRSKRAGAVAMAAERDSLMGSESGSPQSYYKMSKLEKERLKAANDERDKARRRQERLAEQERKALDEERRRRAEKAEKEKQEQERVEKEKAEKVEKDTKSEKEAKAEKDDKDKADKGDKASERGDKASEKDDKTQNADKETMADDKEKDKEKKRKRDKDNMSDRTTGRKHKTKVVRRSKAERQVSSDAFVTERYELGRTLGDGNFAIVRVSRSKTSGHEFAMKVIDKPKLKGKEHMVENEIEIMKDCAHPNIVKLYEEYETCDKIYLVMELVKGGDLFDAITQSVKFGEVDSAHMVADLCNALFYLHSRAIVHRDLKPENLLVHRNKDGTITLKLADFGLAMEVKENIYTVCGTPTYVAPEILTEIGYGLEVDMWAVGVITYILLCGFPPFRSPDRNQTELFEFIKAGEYEFLSPYWDNVSDSAKDLIRRLLVVDKSKRYTAIEVLSHPWIVSGGNTSQPLPGITNLNVYCKEVKRDLEAQAQHNYDSYQKLKEKRRREE